MKGRTLLFTILAILVVAGALYALRQVTNPDASTAKLEHLTPEMQRLVPPEWETLDSKKCNFDDDPEEEGLLLYRYDLAEAKTPEDAKTVMQRGLIGAAIYDSQVAPLSVQPATPQPYRPTEIVTYRLLPDFYAGKGQGYIGESAASWHLFPDTVVDGICQAQELAFLGHDDGDLPTRLSIFRWDRNKRTYLAAHFVGSARVEANVTDPKTNVMQVITYNRVNDRSLLCEARTYTRPSAEEVHFSENPRAFSLDFCFAAPGDPVYPEGAVVAYLRGEKPAIEQDPATLPPGDSFLLTGAGLAPGLTLPAGILSVTHAAAITLDDGGGFRCSDGYAGWTDSPLTWWCGREIATVITEIGPADASRTLTWTLISVVPETANADVHWRIQNVE